MTATQTTPLSPFVRSIHDCRTFDLGGHTTGLLATGAETGGALTVAYITVEPGIGPPPHTHTREAECFFILEGEIDLWVDGVTHTLRAGQLGYGPKDVPHRFVNNSDKTARMLLVVAPGNFDAFVEAGGNELAPGAQTCPPPCEASIAKLLAACDPAGITIHA